MKVVDAVYHGHDTQHIPNAINHNLHVEYIAIWPESFSVRWDRTLYRFRPFTIFVVISFELFFLRIQCQIYPPQYSCKSTVHSSRNVNICIASFIITMRKDNCMAMWIMVNVKNVENVLFDNGEKRREFWKKKKLDGKTLLYLNLLPPEPGSVIRSVC